jgi:hypothetical protein
MRSGRIEAPLALQILLTNGVSHGVRTNLARFFHAYALRMKPERSEARNPDISKARVVPGWEHKVQLEDGLQRAAEYFQGQAILPDTTPLGRRRMEVAGPMRKQRDLGNHDQRC